MDCMHCSMVYIFNVGLLEYRIEAFIPGPGFVIRSFFTVSSLFIFTLVMCANINIGITIIL